MGFHVSMQAEGETQVFLLWSTDDDITDIGWEGEGGEEVITTDVNRTKPHCTVSVLTVQPVVMLLTF